MNAPPSSNIVAPGSPRTPASFADKKWLLPTKNVCSSPVLIEESEILQPELFIRIVYSLNEGTDIK